MIIFKLQMNQDLGIIVLKSNMFFMILFVPKRKFSNNLILLNHPCVPLNNESVCTNVLFFNVCVIFFSFSFFFAFFTIVFFQNHWHRVSPFSILAVISGTATWSWRTWRRCGQKSQRAGRERRSPSLWIRTATFLKCSSEGTPSSSCWEILWSRENELFTGVQLNPSRRPFSCVFFSSFLFVEWLEDGGRGLPLMSLFCCFVVGSLQSLLGKKHSVTMMWVLFGESFLVTRNLVLLCQQKSSVFFILIIKSDE